MRKKSDKDNEGAGAAADYLELKFKVDIPLGWDDNGLDLYDTVKDSCIQLINQKLGSINYVNDLWRKLREAYSSKDQVVLKEKFSEA